MKVYHYARKMLRKVHLSRSKFDKKISHIHKLKVPNESWVPPPGRPSVYRKSGSQEVRISRLHDFTSCNKSGSREVRISRVHDFTSCNKSGSQEVRISRVHDFTSCNKSGSQELVNSGRKTSGWVCCTKSWTHEVGKCLWKKAVVFVKIDCRAASFGSFTSFTSSWLVT